MKAIPIALAALVVIVAAALSRAAEPAAPAAPATPATMAAPARQPALKLETEQDKFSYSLGINVGRSFQKQGFELTTDAFVRGISDGLTNAKPLLSEEEMGQSLQHLREAVAARQRKLQEGAADTLKRGQAFLTENGKKDGVVSLPDGLEYRIIKAGDGPSPELTDTVTVNYSGKLIDGTEFDSSYQRGEPAKFVLGQVIKGWQEALGMMKKGGKWEIFIPSNLAYGQQGRPPVIGPNEVLIFTVELIDIQKQPEVGPQQ